MAASTESIRVLSLIPGRVRLHLPGWTASDAGQIEARVSRLPGVESVQANPLTGNVLIRFDYHTTGAKLLAGLQQAWHDLPGAPQSKPAAKDDLGQPLEGQGPSTSPLLRVGMRGLLGHAAVDSLWFAGGFLGSAIGLPLAGLGPLHVLVDIAVWVSALGSGTSPSRLPATGTQPGPASHPRGPPSDPRFDKQVSSAAGV